MSDWVGERWREPHALARWRARATGQPVLLSLSRAVAAPEDVLSLLHAREAEERFLWQHPKTGFAIVALGATRILRARGAQRFAHVTAACDALVRNAVSDGDGGPIFVGGFAFAPESSGDLDWCGFPPARLILPRLTLVQRGPQATLSVNVMVDEHSDPELVSRQIDSDFESASSWALAPSSADGESTAAPSYEAAAPSLPHWQRAVAETVADIEAGGLDKLVLARACTLRSSRPFDCARVLGRLRRTYPGCTTFWIGTRHGNFLGATPELLVRLHGNAVSTAAMAGTMARGTSPVSDRALRRKLHDSVKERHEHALVVEAIAGVLRPLCTTLDVPAEPQLLALENLQHLVSPIAGTLRQPLSILTLVERLHPSPAVAGYPREVALALLRQREELDRGWYAGPIGWLDAHQQGEFVVGLRSALVRNRQASLFAGAGIVAGSDPEAELAETRLKLQPLLSALMEL